jgi:hypothetical protein
MDTDGGGGVTVTYGAGVDDVLGEAELEVVAVGLDGVVVESADRWPALPHAARAAAQQQVPRITAPRCRIAS